MFDRASVKRAWMRAAGGLSLLLGLLSFHAPLTTQASAGDDSSAYPTEMLEDAELADVCFVSTARGWAVGDRGAIWHTSDGGRHWRLQTTPTQARLESVFFLDGENGWAAGYELQPYSHRTQAVLLRTRDGGQRWSAVEVALLPGLRKIKMIDGRRGWAVGDASPMFPSGVFHTDDSGRTWTAVPIGQSPAGQAKEQRHDGWLCGDFLDANRGALAGRNGASSLVTQSGLREPKMPDLGNRNLRRIVLGDESDSWLVGDRGLIMRSADGGITWQNPAGVVPDWLRREVDLAAIAVQGEEIWATGSPGSVVLHSPDNGRSWEAFRTGRQAPLKAITFADSRRGWAVGALGTILATEDGGRSWQVQHAGGARVAVLGIFSTPGDVPLEIFARIGGNDGYLARVETLCKPDAELTSPINRDNSARLNEALVRLGGIGGTAHEAFPLRQASLMLPESAVLAGWNRAYDGRGAEQMQRQLIRLIRQWRPEVIITSSIDRQETSAANRLLHRQVMLAVEKAADPTCQIEQISSVGLEPWSVKKVFAELPHGVRGSVDIPSAQIAARLGGSLAEQACAPRGLVRNEYQPAPLSHTFQLVYSSLPFELAGRDFFAGLPAASSQGAKRKLHELGAGPIYDLRRAANKQRNMQRLIETIDEDQTGDAWLSRMTDLVRDLSPTSAGEVLFQMGQQYGRSGRPEMAAETYEILVERYPKHPLCEAALVWLIQYYSSAEQTWRQMARGGYSLKKVNTQAPLPEPPAATPARPGEHVGPLTPERDRPVETAPLVSVGPVPLEAGARTDRAVNLGKELQKRHAPLFADPAVQFPLAAARRRQGSPAEATKLYQQLTAEGRRDSWWNCARAEQWLVRATGTPPKSVYECIAAPARPKLDGKLSDPIWKDAKTMEIRSQLSDDDEWPAVALMAYDREFLYVGIICRKAPGVDYSKSAEARPRDAKLHDRDRVELIIDTDRDFTTYFRLCVDHRGWTADDCTGDRGWNPSWFVAPGEEEGVWIAELAIPLSQLTGQLPGPRDCWSLGVQRIVPGVGFQSWTEPAAVDIRPEGNGYLMFR